MSVLRSVLLAVFVGALVLGITRWPGDLPLIWSIGLAVPAAMVTLLGTHLSGNVEPVWSAVPDETASATDMAASTLATRLAEASRDQQRFVTRIQPRLRRLATTVLRQRHHDLSTVDDPRARAVLGDELHHLLTAPTATLPPPAELAALITRLETL